MRFAGLARFQVPIFFVLAYAITWSAQVPAYIYAHDHGHQLTNEQNLLHLRTLFRGELDPGLAPYLFFAIFAFGPTLAGIIVTGGFPRHVWAAGSVAPDGTYQCGSPVDADSSVAAAGLMSYQPRLGLHRWRTAADQLRIPGAAVIATLPAAVHADLHRPGRGGWLARLRLAAAAEDLFR